MCMKGTLTVLCENLDVIYERPITNDSLAELSSVMFALFDQKSCLFMGNCAQSQVPRVRIIGCNIHL